MASTDELVALLHEILQDRFRRRQLIFRFQQLVHEASDLEEEEDEAAEILGYLACDLSFYVQDPWLRRQDASYFGDKRLEEEIRRTLRKLGRSEDPTETVEAARDRSTL